MTDKKREIRVQGKRDKTEPVPFDEALRRLVNTPPRHKIKRPKDWPQDEDPGDPNDPRCPAV